MSGIEGELVLVGGIVKANNLRDIPANDYRLARTVRQVTVEFRGRPGEIEVSADTHDERKSPTLIGESLKGLVDGTRCAILCHKNSGVSAKSGKPYAIYEALDVYDGIELSALTDALFGVDAGGSAGGSPSPLWKTG